VTKPGEGKNHAPLENSSSAQLWKTCLDLCVSKVRYGRFDRVDWVGGRTRAYQAVDIDVGHVLHCFLRFFNVFLGREVVVVCAESYQVRVARWCGAVCDGVEQFVVWVCHAGP